MRDTVFTRIVLDWRPNVYENSPDRSQADFLARTVLPSKCNGYSACQSLESGARPKSGADIFARRHSRSDAQFPRLCRFRANLGGSQFWNQLRASFPGGKDRRALWRSRVRSHSKSGPDGGKCHGATELCFALPHPGIAIEVLARFAAFSVGRHWWRLGARPKISV